MIAPRIPADEKLRLGALRALKLLNTAPEMRFDCLTKMTSRLLDMPIAVISLVDENRQWFKSIVGLAVCETSRDVSFCGHAILGNTPFVIEDALQDPRFADNPLVVESPKIRFYAGIPMKSLDGYAIGTLCVIDTKPRSLSAQDMQLLRNLARITEQEMNYSTLLDSYAQLHTAKEKAIAMAATKGEFLANMSHEIRTPMNGILGIADLLLETNVTEDQKHQIELIQTSAESLVALINDILDFSRIEAGKIQLDHVSFNIRGLLGDMRELLQPIAAHKSLELTMDVEEPVPALVMGDPARLRQVLMNLVGNAIKFTQKGRVVLRVRFVRALEDGAQVRFEVEDTGIGIPSEKQESIFEAFTQSDTSINRRFGGSGLGLTISSQLVRMMGGKLGVTSQQGVGSNFNFEMRLKSSHEQIVPPASKPELPAPVMGSSIRVLLAEDNEINQQVATGFLKKRGYEVVVAANGRIALELYQKQQFHLVLMDHQMPEMDGLEATRQIRSWEREKGRHTPIIAMTANAMTGDRERCLDAGMDDYLPKPIRKEELFRLIDLKLPHAA